MDFLYYILLLHSLYTPSFILTMFTLLVFLIIIFVQQFITWYLVTVHGRLSTASSLQSFALEDRNLLHRQRDIIKVNRNQR